MFLPELIEEEIQLKSWLEDSNSSSPRLPASFFFYASFLPVLARYSDLFFLSAAM